MTTDPHRLPRTARPSRYDVVLEPDLDGASFGGSVTILLQVDGPTDERTIDAMLAWHINTVRLPLNESCWLGINGATDVGGDFYQTLIQEYVDRLHARGIYVVLDLHWTAAGTADGASSLIDSNHGDRCIR